MSVKSELKVSYKGIDQRAIVEFDGNSCIVEVKGNSCVLVFDQGDILEIAVEAIAKVAECEM